VTALRRERKSDFLKNVAIAKAKKSKRIVSRAKAPSNESATSMIAIDWIFRGIGLRALPGLWLWLAK